MAKERKIVDLTKDAEKGRLLENLLALLDENRRKEMSSRCLLFTAGTKPVSKIAELVLKEIGL